MLVRQQLWKDLPEEFQKTIERKVSNEYSEDYYKKFECKKKKIKGAQEAHECIRPTDINHKLNDKWSEIEKKLYNLIVKKTIISHMKPAIYDILTIDLSNENLKDLGVFKGKFKSLKFEGFLIYDNHKVEEFIDFEYEITLLTILEKSGKVTFCNPIGHFQKRGDYQYSWQPADCSQDVIRNAQNAAKKMVLDLGGSGIFGVEFFIDKKGEVIFSELSPRPHDTGMVTMFTQNFSQFDIHARVLLGMPLPEIKINQSGASHVILAEKNASGDYIIEGLEEALEDKNVDYRIFGKPFLKSYRRMGVVLAPSLEQAKKAAKKIFVKAK